MSISTSGRQVRVGRRSDAVLVSVAAGSSMVAAAILLAIVLSPQVHAKDMTAPAIHSSSNEMGKANTIPGSSVPRENGQTIDPSSIANKQSNDATSAPTTAQTKEDISAVPISTKPMVKIVTPTPAQPMPASNITGQVTTSVSPRPSLHHKNFISPPAPQTSDPPTLANVPSKPVPTHVNATAASQPPTQEQVGIDLPSTGSGIHVRINVPLLP